MSILFAVLIEHIISLFVHKYTSIKISCAYKKRNELVSDYIFMYQIWYGKTIVLNVQWILFLKYYFRQIIQVTHKTYPELSKITVEKTIRLVAWMNLKSSIIVKIQ